MSEAKKFKLLWWDLIGVALLICVVAVAQPLWKRPLFLVGLAAPILVAAVVVFKKWKRAGLILPAVYLMAYVGLSLGGNFTIANHGGNDWRREWCPKGLVYEYTSPSGRSKTDFTAIGTIFWPCIFIDHLLWHRTQEANL